MALLSLGNIKAPIVVVCEPPMPSDKAMNRPLGQKHLEMFAKEAKRIGLSAQDLFIICPCDPIPDDRSGSDGQKRKYAQEFHEELVKKISYVNPKVIIPLGKIAASQIAGRDVKITSARGQRFFSEELGKPYYPMLGISYVTNYPEHKGLFCRDFDTFKKFKESGYDPNADIREEVMDYRWCFDIKPFLPEIEASSILSVDTETNTLDWFKPHAKIITVQMSFRQGHALNCPVYPSYMGIEEKDRLQLIADLKKLLENKRIKKTGHNFKYDYLMLRKCLNINTMGWFDDTIDMSFNIDENMVSRSLDECVRRWVPAMAGYNDSYNKKLDKENMLQASYDDMLIYGCGDADATRRLYVVLKELMKSDEKHTNCYKRIVMPGVKTFAKKVEWHGVPVDVLELGNLSEDLNGRLKESKDKLVGMIPESVRKRHEGKIEFTRDRLVRDILFSKDGMGLKPVVFTKSTKRAKDKDQRLASIDIRQHLPFFEGNAFIDEYINYKKLATIKQTFVDNFERYMDENNCIHPFHSLSKAVTGRTSCLAGNTEISVYSDNGTITCKRMKDIVVGDVVVCYDDRGFQSKDIVVWSGETKISDVIKVRLIHRFCNTVHHITCTADHRFRMFNGNYIAAANIKPNWIITSYPIRESYKFGGYEVMARQIPVYDITTEKYHNFIANGVCVHNSSRPNGQNFPKRGELAKAYRKIFRPRPGYCLIEADYSQAELRIIARMSKDPVMMKVYRDGGDIHATTAAAVAGMSIEQFMNLPEKERKSMRQKAKGVNFGLCLTAGSLVLTCRGLVPIESVTKQDKLWDGVEWVNHEGVQYMGYKEVIEYQGLSATPDHVVFTYNGEMTLQEAKDASENLVIAEIEGKEIRVMGSYRGLIGKARKARICAMPMLCYGGGKRSAYRKFGIRKVYWKPRVSDNFTKFQSTRGAVRFNKTEMPNSCISVLRKLRGKGYTTKVQFKEGFYFMDGRESPSQRLQRGRYRENRQRWSLRTRKHSVRNTFEKFIKQENNKIGGVQRYDGMQMAFMASCSERQPRVLVQSEMVFPVIAGRHDCGRNSLQREERKRFAEVYDIKNSGRRHRFTVSGVLVHNCYKMAAKKLKSYVKTDYKVDMTDAEAQQWYDTYFSLYKRLTPWHEYMINTCRKNGYVRGLLGEVHRFPSINSPDMFIRSEAERKCINSPVQNNASQLGVLAMSRLSNDMPDNIGCCQEFVHDAIYVECRIENREEVASAIKWYMENQPLKEYFNLDLGIPLVADVSWADEGQSMADLKEVHIEAKKPSWQRS